MRMYFAKIEYGVIALLLLAVVAALCALSYAQGRRHQQTLAAPVMELPPVVAAPAAIPASAKSVGEEERYLVHVAGAVHKPGVYQLSPGARMQDAVAKAGGACDNACLDALNLAEPVTDAAKITVPTQAEWQRDVATRAPQPVVQRPAAVTPARAVSVSAPVAAAAPAAAPATPVSFPLHINTATAEEFEALPTIGPVTAQRIVEYRAAHGPFTDVAQLLNVPRIGPKTLEKIAPLVTL